jgi:hypothetical protein
MVWWKVSHWGRGGVTSSFLQQRDETGARVYQEDVLQGVVKPLNMTLFIGQEWVFQQDSVPTQKPRRLRSGCRRTFRFYQRLGLALEESIPQPPKYKFWALLEDMA